jgi:hypothetical protein
MHFDQIVFRHATRGRRNGIPQPVIPLIGVSSTVGKAIARQFADRASSLVGHNTGVSFLAFPAITVPEAVQLLHRHAGLGGMAVANLLKDPPKPADCWALVCEDVSLAVAAYRGRKFAFQSGAGYTGDQFLESLGVDADAEEDIDVQLAVALLNLTTTRHLPGGADKTSVGLPVDDDLLARILRRHYASRPTVVVAVLTHLLAVSPKDHDWLRTVLRNRKTLRELSRKVVDYGDQR